MRFLRLVLLGAFILSACTCVASTPAPSRTVTLADIETMRAMTIGIVSDHKIVCAGAWIGPQSILTAAHCTSDDEAQKDGTFAFVTYDPNVTSEDYTIRFAHLKARDAVIDLALLTIDFLLPEHPSASLGPNVPDGSMISIVGHTSGLAWSYTPGFVSGLRKMNGPEEIRGDFLQTWSGAWGGNSGGAAWDQFGRIVGICSFRGSSTTFFVSRDTIARFLSKQ